MVVSGGGLMDRRMEKNKLCVGIALHDRSMLKTRRKIVNLLCRNEA